MKEKCPVCSYLVDPGATKCESCGFADERGINRVWINAEDANHWMETTVKPYRVQWEARKQIAEMKAQLEEAKENEKRLLNELEQMKTKEKRRTTIVAPKPQPLVPTPVSNNFVRIAGGTFQMGSDNGDSNEEPVHAVTISSFNMAKYPVTQKEWFEVTGNNPSKFKGDKLPVEDVTWYDVIEYCNRLSQKEGLTLSYTISGTNVSWNRGANGYRLPTEAEWEYAAYDMSGDVYEWCWDWWGYYPRGAQTDPTGAVSGNYRVIRGGMWNRGGQHLRSTYRDYSYPGARSRYDNIGFRLVRP